MPLDDKEKGAEDEPNKGGKRKRAESGEPKGKDGEPSPAKADHGNARLWNTATKVKGTYHVICSKATSLLKEIDEKEEWGWARASKGPELRNGQHAMRSAITPLADNFFLTELSTKDWAKQMESKHGAATVNGTLKDIGDKVADEINNLGKAMRKVHAMQAQNLK